MRPPTMGLHSHGCVKAESRMQRNQHVRFGGGRLETQVMLCAGRLPYFLLSFAGPKEEAEEIKKKFETAGAKIELK